VILGFSIQGKRDRVELSHCLYSVGGGLDLGGTGSFRTNMQ
jgi:hypothetical protein